MLSALSQTQPISVTQATGLHEPFMRASRQFADRVAVQDDSGSISYAALRERSAGMALTLRSKGVQPGDGVAVLLERSIDCIALLLAILRTGAAYIPCDPRWPRLRKQQILELARPRLAVLRQADADALPEDQAAWMFEPGAGADLAPDTAPTDDADSTVDAGQLAYVLYTSGTSGMPKGVAVSHQAARHFTDWTIAEFSLQAQDRVAGVSSLTFDLSVFDIFSTLSTGAALYLYDHRKTVLSSSLSAFLERHAISVMYSVPTTLALLAARGRLRSRRLDALRLVLFAGEPFAQHQFRQLREQLPASVSYFNLYGPTETNVCTFHRLRETEDGPGGIPIGRAIPQTRLHLQQSPQASDYAPDAGELQVFGPGLMRGYLGQDLDSRSCWVVDKASGERGYRTGDVCRWDGEGHLLFLGRLDSQIKVNGFRVEAEEIERLVLTDPAVEQCIVAAAKAAGTGIALLVAFIVPRTGPSEEAALRERIMTRCHDQLPAYQCPNDLMLIDELPTTVSGKADRKALSAVYEQAIRQAANSGKAETS